MKPVACYHDDVYMNMNTIYEHNNTLGRTPNVKRMGVNFKRVEKQNVLIP